MAMNNEWSLTWQAARRGVLVGLVTMMCWIGPVHAALGAVARALGLPNDTLPVLIWFVGMTGVFVLRERASAQAFATIRDDLHRQRRELEGLYARGALVILSLFAVFPVLPAAPALAGIVPVFVIGAGLHLTLRYLRADDDVQHRFVAEVALPLLRTRFSIVDIEAPAWLSGKDVKDDPFVRGEWNNLRFGTSLRAVRDDVVISAAVVTPLHTVRGFDQVKKENITRTDALPQHLFVEARLPAGVQLPCVEVGHVRHETVSAIDHVRDAARELIGQVAREVGTTNDAGHLVEVAPQRLPAPLATRAVASQRFVAEAAVDAVLHALARAGVPPSVGVRVNGDRVRVTVVGAADPLAQPPTSDVREPDLRALDVALAIVDAVRHAVDVAVADDARAAAHAQVPPPSTKPRGRSADAEGRDLLLDDGIALTRQLLVLVPLATLELYLWPAPFSSLRSLLGADTTTLPLLGAAIFFAAAASHLRRDNARIARIPDIAARTQALSTRKERHALALVLYGFCGAGPFAVMGIAWMFAHLAVVVVAFTLSQRGADPSWPSRRPPTA